MTTEFRYWNIAQNDIIGDPDLILDATTPSGFQELTGINRVRQELVKIMFTRLSEDFMDPTYGISALSQISMSNQEVTFVAIDLALRKAIKHLSDMQMADTTRSANEIIGEIKSIPRVLANVGRISS